MFIHKGAAPNAELTCFEYTDGDSDQKKSLKIILGFYGDMERQKFIDDIATAPKIPAEDHEDEAENQNNKNSQASEDSDEGSDNEIDDQQDEESDGESVEAANYD